MPDTIVAAPAKYNFNQLARPMLARDADSMYWMARYVERAEHVARIVWINSNLLIDVGDLAPAFLERQWESVLTIFNILKGPTKAGFSLGDEPSKEKNLVLRSTVSPSFSVDGRCFLSQRALASSCACSILCMAVSCTDLRCRTHVFSSRLVRICGARRLVAMAEREAFGTRPKSTSKGI